MLRHIFSAVGQGDAHIIECEMSRGGQNEYEFAIVDMGTSSIKVSTKRVWLKELIDKIKGSGHNRQDEPFGSKAEG